MYVSSVLDVTVLELMKFTIWKYRNAQFSMAEYFSFLGDFYPETGRILLGVRLSYGDMYIISSCDYSLQM